MTTRYVNELRLHPLADAVPAMTPDEDDALAADIEVHGVQVPLDITDRGVVLDGRHRLRIAKAFGLAEVPVRVVDPTDEAGYIVRMALLRRHLTTAQRKTLAASLLKQEPQRSDRSVARTVGISPTTVGTVRAEAEASGDVSRLDTRTDTLGRQQPATKPEPQPEPVRDPWPEVIADPVTLAALDEGLREVAAGETVPMGDVIRAAEERLSQDPGVLAAARSERLAKAMQRFTAAQYSLSADVWRDDIERGDIQTMRGHLVVARQWIEAWERLLDEQRPLRVVGGAKK